MMPEEDDLPGPSTSVPRAPPSRPAEPPSDLLLEIYQGMQRLGQSQEQILQQQERMLQAQERMGYDIRSLDLRVGRIEASMGVRAVSDSSDSDDAI